MSGSMVRNICIVCMREDTRIWRVLSRCQHLAALPIGMGEHTYEMSLFAVKVRGRNGSLPKLVCSVLNFGPPVLEIERMNFSVITDPVP